MSDLFNIFATVMMMVPPMAGPPPHYVQAMAPVPLIAHVQCELSGDRGALVNYTFIQTGSPKFLAEYSVAAYGGPTMIHRPEQRPQWAFEQISESAGRAAFQNYSLTMSREAGPIARATLHQGIVEIGRGSCRHHNPRGSYDQGK